MKPDKDEKPITAIEAAAYLGIELKTLYSFVHRRKITFYKPWGKLLYFKKSDLDRVVFRNMKLSNEDAQEQADEILKERAMA